MRKASPKVTCSFYGKVDEVLMLQFYRIKFFFQTAEHLSPSDGILPDHFLSQKFA
jgi:hypothetical protein